MDLLDHLGSTATPRCALDLGVGHLGKADAGELVVEIGAHFPLEDGAAPVARA